MILLLLTLSSNYYYRNNKQYWKQDYKATVKYRIGDGTTYTFMTPKGRAREPHIANNASDGNETSEEKDKKKSIIGREADHMQHPNYWGLSKFKILDERYMDPEFLKKRGTK